MEQVRTGRAARPTRVSRWGRTVLGALMLAVVVGLTACQPIPALVDPDNLPTSFTPPPPLHPLNRPTVAPGQVNGVLDPGLMAPAGPGCQVHRDAAASLNALVAAATVAGIPLRASSCFRDLAGQQAARAYWCGLGQCHMAAVPGTSNHGWGKAVDLAAGNASLVFGSRTYNWLQANAWVFGWNHPGWAEPNGSSPEAWHWEWVGDGGTMFPGLAIGPQRA